MTYQGVFKNGVVVLETDSPPAEGTKVSVSISPPENETIGEFLKRYDEALTQKHQSPPQADEDLSAMLLRYAGCMDGLPPDLAAEHDHYAHGAPKRSQR